MLTCQQIVALVTEYLDGALPVPDVVRLQLHLALCRNCRAFLRQMKTTVSVLNQLPPAEPTTAEARESALATFRSWKSAGESTGGRGN